jgi:hypothetical protein
VRIGYKNLLPSQLFIASSVKGRTTQTLSL